MSFLNNKRKSISLLELLENISLNNSGEQLLVKRAIDQLNNGANNQSVISDLKRKLSSLAVQKNLSEEGVGLLSKLQRPDTNNDYARSSMTWF